MAISVSRDKVSTNSSHISAFFDLILYLGLCSYRSRVEMMIDRNKQIFGERERRTQQSNRKCKNKVAAAKSFK